MIPELRQLIFDYLDAMHEGANLPSLCAFRKLIRRADVYVLKMLGFVIQLPADTLAQVTYNLRLAPDFSFYFRLSPAQRVSLIRLLKGSIVSNVHCANMVWACIMRQPPLCEYPEFRRLFVNSMLVKLIFFLEPNASDSLLL